MTNIIVLIIVYILNIIDYIFTAQWVKNFGIDVEANPFGRWMFENNVAWVFKILIVGILLAALGYFVYKYSKFAWVCYVPFTVYTSVVLYHIGILFYLIMKENLL